jgi:hypothetical protein
LTNASDGGDAASHPGAIVVAVATKGENAPLRYRSDKPDGPSFSRVCESGISE